MVFACVVKNMPWIAVQSGDKVWPEEVEDGQDVSCPECEREMFPRGPTSDGRARHFAHKSDGNGSEGSGCEGGGESDTHKRWKSFAASRLKQMLSDDVYNSIELERSVPLFEADNVSEAIKNKRSEKSTRDADVFLEFEENHHRFGRGIAIEVQYKTKGRTRNRPKQTIYHKGLVCYGLTQKISPKIDARCQEMDYLIGLFLSFQSLFQLRVSGKRNNMIYRLFLRDTTPLKVSVGSVGL